MVFPSAIGPKTTLQRAFSPGQWWKRAAQVLGISEEYAFDLSSGRYPLSKRHIRTIATYCNQRRRARKQIVAREVARLERLWEAAERDWAAAETELRAKEAEFMRQGRK